MNITPRAEIILEGTYLYFNKDVNYSHENFKLIHFPDAQTYHIYAEILSRLETGEFFKIFIRYEINNSFIPYYMRIEKSLGSKFALETYQVDVTNFDLTYTFQTPQGTQEFNRKIALKDYLASPAVSTSAIFTLSKKFDATERTSITLLNSNNDWTYSAPPTEKTIYGEYKARDLPDFQLNGNKLPANLLYLYEFNSSNFSIETPVELYLSKHYNIPYMLVHGDQKIVIKNLKRMTT